MLSSPHPDVYARSDDERGRMADALAGALRRDAAGRLTVFLGAAPGVGKTYAMLQRARELQRQGMDVVIGVVETHGRSDTDALVEGLARVPMCRLDYQGRVLDELDLDALLARRPEVALIDELAHRNAPGSRHQRRWQDVVELLEHGIDVYTTVNIQHIESLNDIVHQITGVKVQETVPDAIFDHLRDIRLVDLPPRELIERMRQGKVYVPEQAAHALQAFFTPGNLAALRELAMQTVADYVDIDLREVRAASGASARMLRRHVLVAIDGGPASEALVRAGRRIAERRGAPWSVINVDDGTRPESDETTMAARRPAERRHVDSAFALARRLGATTDVRYGNDVVTALLDEAAARDASTIVLGRPRRRRCSWLGARSPVAGLLQQDPRYELTIAGGENTAHTTRSLFAAASVRMNWTEAAWSLGAAAVATTLAWFSERAFGMTDLSMIFLMAVLLVAARTRVVAAVTTAVLCLFAYNFFFIEPRYTFYIDAFPGVATVTIFLATALVAGRLASRLRGQVLALGAANSHSIRLQTLGRELAIATDAEAVLRAGRQALDVALGAHTWLALSGSGQQHDEFDDKDDGAATWCLRHGKPAGRYTDTLGSARWMFLPITGGGGVIGVAGLLLPEELTRLSVEQQRLAEAMLADIGEALMRARLVNELQSARVNEETERLRSALLSSVSHDLRSPLSSMIGAAESLAAYADAMPVAERHSLVEMIAQEGHRLDRYIQNLLDMTRLGQEGLTLQRDWIGVDELVGSASSRLARYAPGVRFELAIDPALPLLNVHPALIEQAVFNVLENAWKFSPPGAAIRIAARMDGDRVQIDVSDRGPGISEAERALIFDMFHCVEGGDRGLHGSGLGLAIVKAIVGAHMGSVEALARPDGHGSTIRLSLPVPLVRDESGPP